MERSTSKMAWRFSLVGLATLIASACSSETRTVDLGERSTDPGSFGGADSGADSTADASAILCVATECSAPYVTCPNGDKCGTNISTDRNNCGYCGHVCGYYEYLHVAGRCLEGRCRYDCVDNGHLDCNGAVDDGCEVDSLGDSENCGACGNRCGGGVPCVEGRCGCAPGKSLCGRLCTDLSSDAMNCKVCGSVCPDWQKAGWPEPPPNMHYGCGGGECGQLGCVPGYRNCDGDRATGCETSILSDANNCGACGNACAPGQICAVPEGSVVPRCLCDPGLTLCTRAKSVSCRDLLNDLEACGTCDNSCAHVAALPHMQGACVQGRCRAECVPGYADCDGDRRNGCEVNLTTSAEHCGACGHACNSAEGQPCVEGVCLLRPCDPDAGTAR